jgi:hypothetical protein
MMRGSRVALFSMLFFACGSVSWAGPARGTGNWWVSLNEWEKAIFVSGLEEGQSEAIDRAQLSLAGAQVEMERTFKLPLKAQEYQWEKFNQIMTSRGLPSGVTVGNYVGAIDAIFAEHRFRRLPIRKVIGAVHASFRGAPEENVKQMLEAELRERSNDEP